MMIALTNHSSPKVRVCEVVGCPGVRIRPVISSGGASTSQVRGLYQAFEDRCCCDAQCTSYSGTERALGMVLRVAKSASAATEISSAMIDIAQNPGV